MYGDDYEYASSRLAGTIIRLDDEPIFVVDIRPGMKATIAKLITPEIIEEVDAKQFNLKPVPLGMCNFGGIVSYLTRLPMRRDWKQGLRKGNFTSLCGHMAEEIKPKELREVIKGLYPSFKDSLESLKTKAAEQVAWHREWAITDRNIILYKGAGGVGHYANGEFNLSPEYVHLREALQESL